MNQNNIYHFLLWDLLKVKKDRRFLQQLVEMNNCYHRAVIEKNKKTQLMFQSVHFLMLLFVLHKLHLFTTDLDPMEIIIHLDIFGMCNLEKHINCLFLLVMFNIIFVYQKFHISIDAYYSFQLKSVVNDDCKALFGRNYTFHHQSATNYICSMMICSANWFYLCVAVCGLCFLLFLL